MECSMTCVQMEGDCGEKTAVPVMPRIQPYYPKEVREMWYGRAMKDIPGFEDMDILVIAKTMAEWVNDRDPESVWLDVIQ